MNLVKQDQANYSQLVDHESKPNYTSGHITSKTRDF